MNDNDQSILIIAVQFKFSHFRVVISDLVQAKIIIQLVIVHDFSDSVVSHSENKLKPPALQYFANTGSLAGAIY